MAGYLSLELRYRDLLALFGEGAFFKSLRPTGVTPLDLRSYNPLSFFVRLLEHWPIYE
jgi:hypothetical protein